MALVNLKPNVDYFLVEKKAYSNSHYIFLKNKRYLNLHYFFLPGKIYSNFYKVGMILGRGSRGVLTHGFASVIS